MPPNEAHAPAARSAVDRLTHGAEVLAGCFLAFVTVLTFVAVVLRYVFHYAIPDSFDLSRNFLGILIFWGIAITGFRGEHITVDLLWGALPAYGKRALDVLSTAFTLGCMAVFAWAMAGKVAGTYADHEATFDLNLPVWPFYAVAWAGIAASVLLVLVRLARQIATPARYDAVAVQISH